MKEKKDRLINYNFFHWGPFLYKTSLIKEELKKINSLCSKKNNDYRKNLAGIIKHEHVIDSKKFFQFFFLTFKVISKHLMNIMVK